MELVTNTILVIAAVSLTFGLINLRFWFSSTDRHELLAIACACISIAIYSCFEVAMAHADSPADYGMVVRWAHLPAWAMFVSIAAFFFFHLKAGQVWLLWVLVVARTVGLILNFVFPVNINYLEITEIRHMTILGESLAYPIGVKNPWLMIQFLSFAALIVYSLYAMVVVWRRGERRKGLIFGGGFALFGITSFAIIATVKTPALASPTILFVLIAFAIEMNFDLRRSARLARALAENEAELRDEAESMRISTAVAHLGFWKCSLTDHVFAATDKWYELFGFEPGTAITYQDYLAMIHIEDRVRVDTGHRSVAENGEEFLAEFRVMLKSGQERWISTLVKADLIYGRPQHLRGVSVDVTKRKLAEKAAHELSRKLMGAQEKERARLARELHDDLSQSLALLSIELQSLGDESGGSSAMKKHIADLTAQIQRLSSDVHRISHELHPSKLSQLGLTAALRGFCRETGAVRGIKVGFDAKDVPRDLPNDISLCLYRIAQESLQNTVKHSGASFANVVLSVNDGIVKLMVSDNGCGFDTESVKSKEALGLISMDERIRAIQGTLTIESVIDSGTKIEAHVPLPSV